MRKVLFTFILLAAGFLTHVAAKKGVITLQSPNSHEVLNLSPNGKWACGIFVDGVPRAYLWNLETNERICLGTKGDDSRAYGVSDNGVVCGEFLTTEMGAPQKTGGYWKEGKTYFLRDENGKVVNSTARAISSDGQYIAGCIIEGNTYLPCVWKNGELERRLDSNKKDAVPNGISEDGQIVIGWYFNGNKIPCYWDPELKPMSDKRGGFNNSYSISPNNRYILASDAQGTFIYDLQTEEKTPIPMVTESFNSGATQIMDDKTVLLWEGQNPIQESSGIVYKADGTWKTVGDWLKENWNVDMPEGVQTPGISRFSSDMKRLVGAISNGYDEFYQPIYYQMAWISDQEVDLARPASLNGHQVEATNNILLTWTAPSVNSSAVTGYRIYRNDKKLADVSPQQRAYVDKTAGAAKLTYEVCALYGTDESEKLTAPVNLKEMRYAPLPNTFTANQANQSDVVLNWSAPLTGYDANVRLDNNHYVLPFGGNTEKTYWAAVRFDKDLIDCYSDNFEIRAIDLYVCQKVDELTLTISSNGQELASQTVDQSKLVMNRNNAIVLDKPIDLPAGAEVTVTFKVVQSGAALSMGLADDPAVEGGNLISEDGTEWTTLSELSQGAYTYNWMIGMLLDQKVSDDPGPLAPSLRSMTSPQISGYRFYRDNDKIGELDLTNEEEANTVAAAPFRLVDKQVAPGRHVYEIEAVYNQTFASGKKAYEITVHKQALDKCPAPVHVKAAVDHTAMGLTWDMPEYSEVSYTNWEYQAPFGYRDLAEMYYGVKYNVEKMRPFAGSSVITGINFMPLQNVTFAVVIYENEEEVYRQNISEVSLNKINNVKLDTPLPVLENTDYLAAIYVSGIVDNQHPIGLDTSFPWPDGRQISEKGDYFINAQADMLGNMMISMDVEKTIPGYTPNVSYKVFVDGAAKAENLTENSYSMPIAETDYMKTVTVNVAAVYPDGERKSQDLIVLLDPSGISSEEVVTVKVYPNPASSFVRIEGNVSEASLFDLTGREVVRTGENTLEVGSLPAGTYLLRSTVDGKSYTNKIQVVR